MGQAVGQMICYALGGVVLGMMVFAVLLRATIAIYNKFASGPNGRREVPTIGLGKAMGISLVLIAIQLNINLLVGLVTGHGAPDPTDTSQAPDPIGPLISLPFVFIVLSLILAWSLPTTLSYAAIVSLLYLVIVESIVFAFFILFFTLTGALELPK
jgi:hypothetical protein